MSKFYKGRKADPLFFEKNSEKITETGCWVWLGALHSSGRARVGSFYAARLAYKKYYGSFPENLLVCHSCDMPVCVNPNHLFLGTAKDNTQDAIKKKRLIAGNAKLTENLVREIRERRFQGITAKELSKMYGISISTIYLLRKFKTWSNIK